MNHADSEKTFPFILKALRPFKWTVFLMFLVAMTWALDGVFRPYLLKTMLDRVVSTPAKNIIEALLWPAVLYALSTVAVSFMFRSYDYLVEVKMAPQLRQNLTDTAFGRLVNHSHNFYQNNFAGSLANKVKDLVSGIPEMVQIAINQFFSQIMLLAFAVYALFQINLAFAIMMFVWVTCFMLLAFFFSKRIVRESDEWSELGSSMTGQIVDVLSNMLSVRLFSRQKKERSFLWETTTKVASAERRVHLTNYWMWSIYSGSFLILECMSLYFLIRGRYEGTVSVGDFALVLTLNNTIVDHLWQVAKEVSNFSKLSGQVTQALRKTTWPIEIQDAPDAVEIIKGDGRIVFDSVSFQYKESEALFNNLSIEIPAGQKVGLVGYSGGGKTTFVNLILRLFDVKSGRILVDDMDVKLATQNSLHEKIAMIPQDPSLFHRTLLENIRYGKEDASESEVIEASQKAYAHEFITTLPQGYQSLVGERGIKLSGGQRQRIAIARAILKNAPILILDEATSQLDSVTEKVIQQSLWQLMQNKTTIVIAHRLSTLLRMDRILVFDRGQIIQDGSHAELLAQEGLYKILWDAQVGGFLPEEKV